MVGSLGSQEVRALCPTTSGPGHYMRVMVPGAPVTCQTFLKMAVLTSKPSSLSNNKNTSRGSYGKDSNSTKSLVTKSVVCLDKKSSSIKVKVPSRVKSGMEFISSVGGTKYAVTCPSKVPRNRKIRILPVTDEELEAVEVSLIHVIQDEFIHGNANDRPLLTGEMIADKVIVSNNMEQVTLKYNQTISHGWTRAACDRDRKFQWIYSTNDVVIEEQDENKPKIQSAFCRSLLLEAGKDSRLPTGTISLVPVEEALAEAQFSIVKNDNVASHKSTEFATTISSRDVADIQAKSLEEKSDWFRTTVCSGIAGSWEEGNIKIVVRRQHLLEDSINAVMSLGQNQMRQTWRFEFVQEPGVDSGGLTREWFQLVSEQLFDPASGLWVSSSINQMCVGINPDSANACTGDHLVRYRFAGRLIGRALFDQHVIAGHLVPFLYKHLLGWPLTLQDLAELDEEFYDSLEKLRNIEDISTLCLDFTMTELIGGKPVSVELVPNGTNIALTKDKLNAFMEAHLRYRTMQRVLPQLKEMLLGFLDVVPEPALSVFDPKELELLLCGLPSIDVADWKANTRYSGTFSLEEAGHELVQWFWGTVADFDHDMRARLLQFVTGTAGVPSRGFAALHGSDGELKTFGIRGTEMGAETFPKAQTCFNRIDLPQYTTKEELCAKLTSAITLSAVGFGMD